MSNPYLDLTNYKFLKTLGEGNFGKVKLAIFKNTNEEFAIKILNKKKIKIKMKNTLFRENEIVKKLHHKNIVYVSEILEDDKNYYIIMEYCKGGELFDYIVQKQRLCEDEASIFFYQLINGVEYIHSQGVAHRDLKPENLLFNEKGILKIIDFGLSHEFDGVHYLKTKCGSPSYASPELITDEFYDGFKTDIWCCGIILYAMLCGFLPFEGDDNTQLFKCILECDPELPRFLSKDAKKLIRRILVVNPELRVTIKDIKNSDIYLKGKEFYNLQYGSLDIDNEYLINEVRNTTIQECTMEYEKSSIKKSNSKYNEDSVKMNINTNNVKGENEFDKNITININNVNGQNENNNVEIENIRQAYFKTKNDCMDKTTIEEEVSGCKEDNKVINTVQNETCSRPNTKISLHYGERNNLHNLFRKNNQKIEIKLQSITNDNNKNNSNGSELAKKLTEKLKITNINNEGYKNKIINLFKSKNTCAETNNILNFNNINITNSVFKAEKSSPKRTVFLRLNNNKKIKLISKPKVPNQLAPVVVPLLSNDTINSADSNNNKNGSSNNKLNIECQNIQINKKLNLTLNNPEKISTNPSIERTKSVKRSNINNIKANLNKIDNFYLSVKRTKNPNNDIKNKPTTIKKDKLSPYKNNLKTITNMNYKTPRHTNNNNNLVYNSINIHINNYNINNEHSIEPPPKIYHSIKRNGNNKRKLLLKNRNSCKNNPKTTLHNNFSSKGIRASQGINLSKVVVNLQSKLKDKDINDSSNRNAANYVCPTSVNVRMRKLRNLDSSNKKVLNKNYGKNNIYSIIKDNKSEGKDDKKQPGLKLLLNKQKNKYNYLATITGVAQKKFNNLPFFNVK